MKNTYKCPEGQKPGGQVKSTPGAKLSGAKLLKTGSNLMKGNSENRGKGMK
jgi:hypothetical protein